MKKERKTPTEEKRRAIIFALFWLIAFAISYEFMSFMTNFSGYSFESNPFYVPGLLCVFLSFIMTFVNMRKYWNLRGIDNYDDWLEVDIGESMTNK